VNLQIGVTVVVCVFHRGLAILMAVSKNLALSEQKQLALFAYSAAKAFVN